MLMNLSTLKTISLCLHVICGFVLISPSFQHAFAKEATTKPLTSGLNGKAPLLDEEIQSNMKQYLGVPYKRAGASKMGFDCSGFVKIIYREVFGVDLPHQSSQQSLSSDLVGIPLDKLKTGDLIFFSTSGKNRPINHVGIYFSDGKFIHAARSRGVVVSELNEPYWRSKIVGAKRLVGLDQMQSERTALDLALFFDRENAVFFRYERNDFSLFTPSLFENQPIHPFATDELHRVEFDYARGIYPSLISHFTLFRETLLLSNEEKRFGYHPILGNPDHYEKTGPYAQGLRLAGKIAPLSGLSFTPSLSYLDYGPSIRENALPKLVAGLDFDLISSSDGWALSTAMRMSLSRYPSSLLDDGGDDPTMDISVTYRQRLSSRVQLSLSGEKFIGSFPGLKDSRSRPDSEDERLTLMLHFFY